MLHIRQINPLSVNFKFGCVDLHQFRNKMPVHYYLPLSLIFLHNQIQFQRIGYHLHIHKFNKNIKNVSYFIGSTHFLNQNCKSDYSSHLHNLLYKLCYSDKVSSKVQKYELVWEKQPTSIFIGCNSVGLNSFEIRRLYWYWLAICDYRDIWSKCSFADDSWFFVLSFYICFSSQRGVLWGRRSARVVQTSSETIFVYTFHYLLWVLKFCCSLCRYLLKLKYI